MRFRETSIPGVFLIDIEPIHDERGFFARLLSNADFQSHGLVANFPEVSISFNPLSGTLRGMHFQAAPHEETKLVRCIVGAVYDVVIDLRRDSPAYLDWLAVEISAEERTALYVPRGCAHGFQTLSDRAELMYMIDVPYAADQARGIRWDDPSTKVRWPNPPTVISQRDQSFPDWTA